MPSFTSLADYPKIEPLATTPAKLIALIRDKPMDFEPGEKWLYDNSGYVLLTYVIERSAETATRNSSARVFSRRWE